MLLQLKNSQIKILIVDDEPDVLEIIRYNLEKEQYRVFLAKNGKEAIDIALKENPQLIILDIMMPEMDGIETCHALRAISVFTNTLIAFLTARNEDYSQIAGFSAGADDYINKPIKPKVLMGRIKALLRRYTPESSEIKTAIGGLELDREQYLIFKNGIKIELPKKEFELIALLMSKPGKVYRREDILANVWGTDIIVGDRTIDVHINKLREKLGEEYIKTVKGVGYKFVF